MLKIQDAIPKMAKLWRTFVNWDERTGKYRVCLTPLSEMQAKLASGELTIDQMIKMDLVRETCNLHFCEHDNQNIPFHIPKLK